MKKEEIIEKLKGLQRYYMNGGSGVYEGHVESEEDDKGEWINHDDIDDLINELEKPELFCETVNTPYTLKDNGTFDLIQKSNDE